MCSGDSGGPLRNAACTGVDAGGSSVAVDASL